MLKLVKIGLINWYLASREDLDVAGHLAILGRNTHGKSTLLDMMQTVLTGYNKSFSDFNASAADGKKKKSKRTVRDYCLGAYSIGLFVRPTARTVIFLGFEDATTNRKMTIGVALEADKNVSGEHLLDRFIVEGAVLSTDLFVEKVGAKDRVRDWPSARAALQQAGTAVHFDTSSENYIKNWTRLGSTGKRPINPKRLMKALVNAISFEEISSASDFVKRYILGDDKLDIGELKTSIKTYHDLHRRIVDLKKQLDDADEIIANARLHERYFKLSDDWNGAAALLDFTAARSINMGLRRDASRHRAKAAKADGEIVRIRNEIATQEAAITAINQVLAADINKNSKRAVLEAQRDKEKERRDNAEKNLSKLWRLACRLVQDMNAVSKLSGIGPIADSLGDLARTVTSAQHPHWPADADRQTVLAAAADILGHAVKTQDNLRNFAGTLATSRIQAESRIAELDGILRNIRQHGMAVTLRTTDFISVLKEAGMDPKVLCQLIEVTDETWRDAAEVMLGADREAIIVGSRHARSAKQILRDGGSKFDGLRIVGTDKEDWKASDTRPDSLAAIVASDDVDARILVSKRLGSIRRVEHVSEMSRAGRAITPDLVFDDGIVTTRRRLEGGRKIGSSAANPAQLAAEVSGLENEARSIATSERILGQALNTLGEFAQLSGIEIESIVDSFAIAEAALAAANDAYKKAEEDIDPELAQELENANITLADCRTDLEKALDKRKDHLKEIESADRIRQQGEASLGSDFSVLKKRSTLKHHRSQANRRDAFAHARGLVGSKANANLLKSATDKAWSNAAKARDDLTREKGKVYDGVMEFNSRYQAATGYVRNVTPITEIKLYFENLAEQIRTGSLVEHEEKAQLAANDSREMFKTSFVASLNDKLGYIDDEIERLNYSLAQHRFHGERYRFKAMPAADMEELVDFVRRAANDDVMLSSLIDGEAPESKDKNAALINRILFDESFDISRFDDYKEYMTFDLLMHSDELKTEVNLEGRRGIGSGAEKQVPFYVAIGAALAVAWHGGKDSKKSNPLGIGLAMFDEAFTKMDGGNQRACIDFFKGLGLQIVIAAPPEKQAIAGENLDSVIYVIKDGTRVEFIADVFKPKVKKAIEAANPRPTKEDARLSLEKRQRTEAAE